MILGYIRSSILLIYCLFLLSCQNQENAQNKVDPSKYQDDIEDNGLESRVDPDLTNQNQQFKTYSNTKAQPAQQTQVAPQGKVPLPPHVSQTTHVQSKGNPPHPHAVTQQTQQLLHQYKQRINVNPTVQSQRSQQFAQTYPQQLRQSQQTVVRVQSQIQQNRPGYNQWFNDQFFERHRYRPDYYRNLNYERERLWQGYGWTVINNWLPYGWGSPIYYDNEGFPIILSTEYYKHTPAYFNPEYAVPQYYEPENPYYYQQQTPYIQPIPLPPSEYAPQTPYIRPIPLPSQQNIPETPSEKPVDKTPKVYAPGRTQERLTQQLPQGDWLPLGTFVVGKTATEASFSNLFVQLAIDKQGNIEGTYYNAGTDQTHPVVGLIDRDTQLAGWKITDDLDSPIMTTGLYNLTQDMASVKVHFPDGREENWVLVKLKE